MGVAEHVASHGHACGVDVGTHMAGDQFRHSVSGLGGCQMSDAVEDDQPSVLDPGRDASQAVRRRRDVLGARDRQYRRGDFAKTVGDVEFRERLARLGVGLVVGVAQRVHQSGDDVGLTVDEAGAEPCAASSTMASVPDVRTVAARDAQSSGHPITAPVHSSAAVNSRSGASSSSCKPTAPPIESPA
jgi:hypothetical protein